MELAWEGGKRYDFPLGAPWLEVIRSASREAIPRSCWAREVVIVITVLLTRVGLLERGREGEKKGGREGYRDKMKRL
jgi:hypothetical protein